MGKLGSTWQSPGTFTEPAGALESFGIKTLQGARVTMVDPPARGREERGRTVTIRKKGKEPIRFREGALHRQLGVPEGQKIPESKKRAALAGRYGPKAAQRARFAFKGALAAGRRTAAR